MNNTSMIVSALAGPAHGDDGATLERLHDTLASAADRDGSAETKL
jgi:hypothetical protein